MHHSQGRIKRKVKNPMEEHTHTHAVLHQSTDVPEKPHRALQELPARGATAIMQQSSTKG